MITKHEQKQLKRFLGPQYSKEVLKFLSRKRIRNQQGRPHSAAYVRLVFQGYRYNKDIENALWELANQNKKRFIERSLIKSDLIKNK